MQRISSISAQRTGRGAGRTVPFAPVASWRVAPERHPARPQPNERSTRYPDRATKNGPHIRVEGNEVSPNTFTGQIIEQPLSTGRNRADDAIIARG